ncbi:hypothetical protein MN116_006669 [Schistosoma mekongi]|uniref:Saposin B-type domain-containing protein n=1 Tax=Schistosoma mekongi TaxID=38744 RepID=A0AAE1Z8I0_SCHME|nr:hypothetical protein MN116_006669 [Schistosoma mekongi]
MLLLMLIFIVPIVTGFNNVMTEKSIQNTVIKSGPSNCHLLCELCTSIVNATKDLLENEQLLPEILNYLTPICYMLPKLQYRQMCYHIVDGGLTQWISIINDYMFCSYIRLCNNTIPCPDVEDTITMRFHTIPAC